MSPATILAEAFAADPLWTWMARGRYDVARTTPVFAAMVASAEAAGVHVNGGAAAVWHPPERWRLPARDIAGATGGLVRCYGVRGLSRPLRVLRAHERVHPTEPHWYLELLGTLPGARRRGLAGQLLEQGLARCDSEGLGAYLESSNPANHAFYRRFGFVDRAHVSVPRGCPPSLAMWRAPR